MALNLCCHGNNLTKRVLEDTKIKAFSCWIGEVGFFLCLCKAFLEKFDVVAVEGVLTARFSSKRMLIL